MHQVLFRGKDLVLWEGRGNPEAPKVECVPPALQPLNAGDPGLLAVVSQTRPAQDLAWFCRDDVSGLASWVIERFSLTFGNVSGH